MQRLIFITQGSDRYLRDIAYIKEQLGDGYEIVVFGMVENSHKDSQYFYAKRFSDIYKYVKENDIVVGYGRSFGGPPMGSLAVFFLKRKVKKILVIDDGLQDGLGIDMSNVAISMRDILIFGIFKKYVSFYGLWGAVLAFLYRFFVNLKDMKSGSGAVGLIEFNLTQQYQRTPAVFSEKKQILFVEQPFLTNLSKGKTSDLFVFLNAFCEKNTDYEIVFKIHPRGDKSFYEKNIQAKNIRYEKGDIYKIIGDVQYIVGFFSTVLYIGASLGKKVVVIDPIKVFKDVMKFELLEYENTTYMASPSSLETMLYSGKKKNMDKFKFNIDAFKKQLV